MQNSTIYAGIETPLSTAAMAGIFLKSISFDGTSTWGKGADRGFEAFLDASENMELYDIETASEVYKQGVHILPPAPMYASAEAMYEDVYRTTKELLTKDKFLTFFGGEHSISIGIIKAFYEHFNNLTILQIDAHTDLRPSYMGTPYNHACAVYDASQNANLVQVGIRSMDRSEMAYVNSEQCFFAHDMHHNDAWIQQSIDRMTDKVYITFDLDALDPSIMPATGTPEPGGLNWYTTVGYLRQVFEQRQVVGFDIVELAPIPDFKAPAFLAAKLYYKMLTYKFCL